MKDYYINKENGNLVTWGEMMREMTELYDSDDPTNYLGWLNWEEYYDYAGKFDMGE